MTRSVYGSATQTHARRIFYTIAEILHTSASYLGIAALVAVALALTVPPLRDQVRHAHLVLASALQPDGFRLPYAYALTDPGVAPGPSALVSISPVMASDELTWAEGASAAMPGDISEGATVEAPHLNFTRALADSEDESAIAGVSAAQAQALRSYISRKYKIAGSVAGAIISTAFTVGRERDLDPQLLLAVIAIESRYNPYAESHMGAQGLMQVMTKVHKEKFAAFGEGPMAAVHPLANMQVGAQILSDCIGRRGSLDGGLACYVGATGPSDGGYGAKVKAEWRRIALASGVAIQR